MLLDNAYCGCINFLSVDIPTEDADKITGSVIIFVLNAFLTTYHYYYYYYYYYYCYYYNHINYFIIGTLQIRFNVRFLVT